MENIKKLNDQISIKTNLSLINFDRISLLMKKYAKEQIGEMELNLKAIKVLLAPGIDGKILDDMLEGDLTTELYNDINKWGKDVLDIFEEHTEAKKKQKVS